MTSTRVAVAMSSDDPQVDDDVVVTMNHDSINCKRNVSCEEDTTQHNDNKNDSKSSLDDSESPMGQNNGSEQDNGNDDADDNDDDGGDDKDGVGEDSIGPDEQEDSNNNNSDDNNDDPSGDENDSNESENSDSQDDEDEDDGNEEEGGLSALEKRRFERIQRNNAVLSSLGLGDLKKSFVKPKQQRTKKEVDLTTDRRTSSRSSKKQVNYADMPLKFQYRRNSTGGSSTTMEQNQSDQPKRTPKRGENDKDKRLERFIYHEFMRIRSSRRHDVKMAEKQLKWAHTEHRFASKRASLVTQRIKRKQEVQKKQSASLESELQTFGVSLKQLLNDVEKRQMELHWALAHHQQNYVVRSFGIVQETRFINTIFLEATLFLTQNPAEQSPEKQEQLEKQRLEHERRMELIDAMNGFPKALKVRQYIYRCIHIGRNPLCLCTPSMSNIHC
jgi:hypothetical protein